MIRRSVLERTGLKYDPAFRHAEDRDLWTRLAPYTAITSLPKVLVHYRILPTSVCRVHRAEQRVKDAAITRREVARLLGQAPPRAALETLLNAFGRGDGGEMYPDPDFAGAADLLFQAYRRFCQRPLAPTDQRAIERDVAWRLLVLGRYAALHSTR
ncbi:MAG: hypothetical protein D6818_09620, partial [Bacteroidetes bacterium]